MQKISRLFYDKFAIQTTNDFVSKDDFGKLRHFILFGSENNNLYVNNHVIHIDELTCLDNLLEHCKYDDILDIVTNYIKNITNESCSGQGIFNVKGIKNNLIYVLARCCCIKLDDDPLFWKKDFKVDCFKRVLDVCYNSNDLFLFIHLYEKLNFKLYGTTGWNYHIKQMVHDWYHLKSVKDLAFQITRYKSAYGWSHRDVLRLAHVKPSNDMINSIFKYITQETVYNNHSEKAVFDYLIACNGILKEYNIDKVIEYICTFNLTLEQIPKHLLDNHKVWVTLIPNMSTDVLLLNLNKISSLYILDDYPDMLKLILDKIKHVQMNPLKLFVIIKKYKNDSRFIYKMPPPLKWKPNPIIIQALYDAFYNSFSGLKSIDKKILVVLDTSPSMSWNNIVNDRGERELSISAADISCVMAMMLQHVGKHVNIVSFDISMKKLDISSRYQLDKNLEQVKNKEVDNIDSALPFVWAMNNNEKYDAVIIITDDDSVRQINPSTALQVYRDEMNINTKLIMMKLTSELSRVSSENDDIYTLNMHGFNTHMYSIMNTFLN